MGFIGNVSLLRLLIVLKLFAGSAAVVHKTGSSGSNQKSFICVVDTGLNCITTLPEECTAVASYSSNTDTGLNAIEVFRRDRGLPYLLIIDNYSNEEIQKRVKPDEIEDFIDEISETIKKLDAQAVLFDYMNSDETSGSPDLTFQAGIQNLFSGLKNNLGDRNLVIGLGLTKNEAELNHAFIKSYIDAVVDFYVADTVYYNDCKHEDHQADMANIAPYEEIQSTLIMMTTMGFSEEKLTFIIRIVVRSTDSGSANSGDDTSYSDLCASDRSFGKKRKFCTETLTNFYKKGLLVHQRKLSGVIVQSPDRDDYAANCGKNKYAAVKSIKAGMEGSPEPMDITGEPNWAILARDRD